MDVETGHKNLLQLLPFLDVMCEQILDRLIFWPSHIYESQVFSASANVNNEALTLVCANTSTQK